MTKLQSKKLICQACGVTFHNNEPRIKMCESCQTRFVTSRVRKNRGQLPGQLCVKHMKRIIEIEREFDEDIISIIKDFATVPDYLGRTYGADAISYILDLSVDVTIRLMRQYGIVNKKKYSPVVPTKFEDEVYTKYGYTLNEWRKRNQWKTIYDVADEFDCASTTTTDKDKLYYILGGSRNRIKRKLHMCGYKTTWKRKIKQSQWTLHNWRGYTAL